MHNAGLTAGAVLRLANRDQMLPGFAKYSMPKVPAGEAFGLRDTGLWRVENEVCDVNLRRAI